MEIVMAIPKFKTKQEILDYAFNGSDPWIVPMVRHKIEQSGAYLNVADVNTYIEKELKSFQNDYDDWLDNHG
jgi:hypothetical protein